MITPQDFKVGDQVKAFHPRSFGVIWSGEVTKVGRKYVHVRYGIDQRTYPLHPKYITSKNGEPIGEYA